MKILKEFSDDDEQSNALRKEENMKSKITNIITWIILIAIFIIAINFYKSNNFNEFIKSEVNLHTSEFKRDNQVKYSKSSSYKINTNIKNDAIFYKKVNLKKNTPYKVTCMVKTENVIPENNISGVGAHISIIDTTEKSISIVGTQDWQKIEMIFDSKDRQEVDVGFRLGGYLGECTGTAWFSDFTLEEGTKSINNNWKFGCFIFTNTDVNVDGKEIKLSMTNDDILDIKDTIQRFETTLKTISHNKATAECDINIIQTPINKLAYDEEFGNYVASEDIDKSIRSIVDKNEYDHIFAIIRLGNDKYKNEIQINDWIGLRLYGLLWDRLFKYKITKLFNKLYV